MSLTKALFELEKHWRLGTPLLPSMLTIIQSRFLTNIAFFLNNSNSNGNGNGNGNGKGNGNNNNNNNNNIFFK